MKESFHGRLQFFGVESLSKSLQAVQNIYWYIIDFSSRFTGTFRILFVPLVWIIFISINLLFFHLNSFVYNCVLFCLVFFVCFGISRPIREFFTHMETSFTIDKPISTIFSVIRTSFIWAKKASTIVFSVALKLFNVVSRAEIYQKSFKNAFFVW